MPDCYYVVNPGTPDEIGRAIGDCVRDHGGRGRLRKLKKAADRVHAYVFYADAVDAHAHLHAIKACLQGKGHTIFSYAVLGTDEELGFEEFEFKVEGYSPDSDSESAAS